MTPRAVRALCAEVDAFCETASPYSIRECLRLRTFVAAALAERAGKDALLERARDQLNQWFKT
jgi:hypothetical protein